MKALYKTPEQNEEITPKGSKQHEIIRLRAEINKTEIKTSKQKYYK